MGKTYKDIREENYQYIKKDKQEIKDTRKERRQQISRKRKGLN